jgi:hypothetical protein
MCHFPPKKKHHAPIKYHMTWHDMVHPTPHHTTPHHTQAKLFVEHLHESHAASLLAALDSERWTQADVTPQRQAEIDRLVAGKALLLEAGGVFSPKRGEEEGGGGDGGGSRRSSLTLSGDGGGGGGEEGEAVVVNGGGGRRGSKAGSKAEPSEAVVGEEGGGARRYKAVWSALLLLGMLMEYLQVAAHFPSLAMDVMQRVVDLLRVRLLSSLVFLLGVVQWGLRAPSCVQG